MPHTQLAIPSAEAGAAAAVGHVARHFPWLTRLQLPYPTLRPCPQFEAALAALPAGCWPAVTAVDQSWSLPPRATAQLPRLCPNLREAFVLSYAAADLAVDLRGLAAASGLEVLNLVFSPSGARGDSAAAEAAGWLAMLRGLRRLTVHFGEGWPPHDAATELLLAPLPALTSLTALSLSLNYASQPLKLRACPAGLLELRIVESHDAWDTLVAAARPLPSITQLELIG